MEKDIIQEFLQNRPVDPVNVRAAVHNLVNENNNIKRGLLAGSENKHRYSGIIVENLHDEAACSCGETVIFRRERKVPWAVISSILHLVQNTIKHQK